MTQFLERLKTLAAAAVAWLILAQAVLVAVAPVLAELAPTGWETAAEWAVRAAAVLGTVITVVRSVTPVPKAERGLLTDDQFARAA